MPRLAVWITGYPVAGRKLGAIEHVPYPPAVLEFERRLRESAPAG